MVEQVQDLDRNQNQNRDQEQNHVHYHQHHRMYSRLIFLKKYFSLFLIVVVQLKHQNGMVIQVIVYIYHHLIHVHLDVILKKYLENSVQ
jgi:hypothetical protein